MNTTQLTKPQQQVCVAPFAAPLLRLSEVCAGLLDGAQQVREGHHGADGGGGRAPPLAPVAPAEAVGRQVDGGHAVDACARFPYIQSGAATCSKGFVKCLPGVPRAVGFYSSNPKINMGLLRQGAH